MILFDFCRFSVFFKHFWSILIPGGFVRPRKNSRHTNSARRIETGRLEALEIPQIPRKIDFELVFWAGPGPGPGPGRAGPGPGRARAGPGLGRARPGPGLVTPILFFATPFSEDAVCQCGGLDPPPLSDGKP